MKKVEIKKVVDESGGLECFCCGLEDSEVVQVSLDSYETPFAWFCVGCVRTFERILSD